jgi:hypothetical protein
MPTRTAEDVKLMPNDQLLNAARELLRYLDEDVHKQKMAAQNVRMPDVNALWFNHKYLSETSRRLNLCMNEIFRRARKARKR